jgi:Ca2+-binding RTX toxin-like protein
MTKGVPSDPSLSSQWHLVGTWGLHADRVWMDYTGAGVLVAVLDDGFQYTHHELTANYRTDLDWDTLGNDADAAPVNITDRHGTSVMGTIIGDDNGVGTVGVAFDAQGFGIRQGFGAESSLDDTLEAFQYARTKNAFVMNNSWGYTDAFADDADINFMGNDFIDITHAMKDLVDFNRGGLGASLVFSAGNSRASGDNVNYHNLHNSPYAIAVGAIDNIGHVMSFSTPGAAILVSAGGGNVLTTDRTGSDGYNGTSDYTQFSGTSASAPIVTGLIALMMEANPNLGWRDVKEILAYSAQFNNSTNSGWKYNSAGNWNGGGLHFSHDFGFGAADAFTAVRLAETWTLQQTSANMTTIAPISAAPALAIPATGTVTTTINVASNIEIEHVLVHLDITHARAGDLVVTLVSPTGMESVLINHPSNGAFTGIYGVSGIDFDTSSNAHWGESSAGLWTLRIQDTVAGNTGTLNNWSVSFMGNTVATNDTYFFSDNFGAFTGTALTARSVIADTDGGTDTLNLAMVTTNSAMNLTAGTSTIAGKTVTVASGTTIENIYGGDGNDTLTGNASDNLLYGGRGNDILSGMGGNDTLDGRQGTDTVVYAASIADFSYTFVNPTQVNITHTGGALGTDTVKNVENFTFTEGTYTRAQLETYAAGGAMPSMTTKLSWGTLPTQSYTVLSTGVENRTLTSSQIKYGTGGNLVTLDRPDASHLTLTYLSLAAPKILRLDGSESGETLTIAGTVAFTGLTPTIYAAGGNDTIALNLAVLKSYLYGGNGDDTITGNTGIDTLYGDAGNDTLTGGATTDYIYGGADNDTLNGDAGADRLYGGDGGDTINGGTENDYIYGELGDDTLNGGLGIDYLYGGDGMDIMYGDAGNDKLYGDGGNDTLNGGDGIDYLYGYADNDTLNGGIGADKLYGGDGTDTLNGDNDADTLYGEAGNDTLNGGAANDTLYGGDGSDTLNGGTESDRLFGDAGDDNLRGDAGNDLLTGGLGNDTLRGGDGTDVLTGEDGIDILIGGAGADRLTGGTGSDEFVLTDLLSTARDTIADFVRGGLEGDKLNIIDVLSGFDSVTDDISLFVKLTHTTTSTTFAINADGVGTDFVQAALIMGTSLSGTTALQLLNEGTLIVNHSVV